MLILDLCSGAHSWTNIFEWHNHTIFSVDISPRYKPTRCINLMDWDYKHEGILPQIIFASPDCSSYFTKLKPYANNVEKEMSVNLAKKCFEIIRYFKPKWYCVENPNAKMKLYFKNSIGIDYCMYGVEYKKPTSLWTNIPIPIRVCNHSYHLQSINSIKGSIARSKIPDELTEIIYHLVTIL